MNIFDLASVAFLIVVVQFLASKWLESRLTQSIKFEYDRKLEEFRYDIRVREQAARVAEYMELARKLEEGSAKEDYQRANRLAWELAMWLPADIYMLMAESLVKPNEQKNPLAVVIRVRKLLLGDTAGELTQDNIISHAPGIGKNRDESTRRAN